MTVYTILFTPSNFQKALLWKSPRELAQIATLNRNPMSGNWSAHEGFFYDKGGKLPQPDITMLLPGFSFRASAKDLIFPSDPAELELLSIDVEGTDWLFANSLRSTMAYDSRKSNFMRSIDGQIFFITRLVLTDSSLKDCEIFTIADSNRASPIFTEPFVRRLEKSQLKRMNFKEIGEIV